MPRAVDAGDEVERRVVRQQRLPDEREPEVDVLLVEDPDRLVELLADERRVDGGQAAYQRMVRLTGPVSPETRLTRKTYVPAGSDS